MANPRELHRKNEMLAKALGWQPEDFGITGHGPKLFDAVLRWQQAHMLPATGVCDAVTWRAVLDSREGAEDKQLRAKREEGLAGLCSVSRYAPGAAAVQAAAPFEGVVLYTQLADIAAGQLTKQHSAAKRALWQPVQLAVQYGELGVPKALELTGSGEFKLLGRVALAGRRPEHWAVFASGVANAVHTAGGVAKVPGLVLELDAESWAHVVRAPESFAALVQVLRFDLPGVAVAVQLALRANNQSEQARLAWRVLGHCDAAVPPVPGAWPNGSIEAALGQSLTNWSIFAHIRPCFSFPVYHAHAKTTAAQVHRFRHWLHSRGSRGHGWAGSTEHLDALLGPLPEQIHRIDN